MKKVNGIYFRITKTQIEVSETPKVTILSSANAINCEIKSSTGVHVASVPLAHLYTMFGGEITIISNSSSNLIADFFINLPVFEGINFEVTASGATRVALNYTELLGSGLKVATQKTLDIVINSPMLVYEDNGVNSVSVNKNGYNINVSEYAFVFLNGELAVLHSGDFAKLDILVSSGNSASDVKMSYVYRD